MNFLELGEKYELRTFLSLVRVAGLEEAFGDFGDYTLFVPNEIAFLGRANLWSAGRGALANCHDNDISDKVSLTLSAAQTASLHLPPS